MGKIIKSAVIMGIILIAAETALLYMLGHACIHTDVYATEENTFEVTFHPDKFLVTRAIRRPNSVSIYSGDIRYVLTCHGPNIKMTADELVDALRKERTLTAIIKKGKSLTIVDLKGANTTYMTIEDFNYMADLKHSGAWVGYVFAQILWFGGAAFCFLLIRAMKRTYEDDKRKKRRRRTH